MRQSACAAWCESNRRRPAELPELDFEVRCAGSVRSSLVWKTLEGEHERGGPARASVVFQLSLRWFHHARGLIAERVKGHVKLIRTPRLRRTGAQMGSGSVAPISRVQEVS